MICTVRQLFEKLRRREIGSTKAEEMREVQSHDDGLAWWSGDVSNLGWPVGWRICTSVPNKFRTLLLSREMDKISSPVDDVLRAALCLC